MLRREGLRFLNGFSHFLIQVITLWTARSYLIGQYQKSGQEVYSPSVLDPQLICLSPADPFQIVVINQATCNIFPCSKIFF